MITRSRGKISKDEKSLDEILKENRKKNSAENKKKRIQKKMDELNKLANKIKEKNEQTETERKKKEQKEREEKEQKEREKERKEKEAKREKVRQEKEAREEKERQEKEAKKEKERQEKEAKKEKERQEKEAREEKERQEKEAKKEKERQEKEAREEKERKKKEQKEREEKELEKEVERRFRIEKERMQKIRDEEKKQKEIIEEQKKKNKELEEKRKQIYHKFYNWPSQANSSEFQKHFETWIEKKRQVGINFEDYDCPKNHIFRDFPHQLILDCITPERFDRGVLLNYMTGSGKTDSMIKILNNCFADPRPKLFFGENLNQIDNFIKSLIENGFKREKPNKKNKNKYFLFLKAYFLKHETKSKNLTNLMKMDPKQALIRLIKEQEDAPVLTTQDYEIIRNVLEFKKEIREGIKKKIFWIPKM